MIKKTGVVLLSFIAFAVMSNTAFALPAFLDKRPDKEQKEDISKKSSEILNKLYAAQPEAKSLIQKAYGYATFSNFGMKIFFAGGGTGRGVAVNNKTKQQTFMNMAEVQAGLGIGVKSFMLVWVFDNESAFNNFVNSGWEIGGQASAAAKAGDTGGAYQGAVQVAPGIWIYQLTDTGLALELTAKGTKYYKDEDLNKVK
jgi:lipid-binding SYLF domain-containing protein